jgi:hypothetical protein
VVWQSNLRFVRVCSNGFTSKDTYIVECAVDLECAEVVRQLELVCGVGCVDDEVKLELVLVGPAPVEKLLANHLCKA